MNLILISVFVSFVIFPYCRPLIRHVPEKLARVDWTGSMGQIKRKDAARKFQLAKKPKTVNAARFV